MAEKKYIDRDAAILAINNVPEGNWSNKRYVAEVQAIPVADVEEVVHSRWNEDGLSLVCAHCGWTQYHDVPYHFCPNCGARCDL